MTRWAALSINPEPGESAIRQRPLLAHTGGRSFPAKRSPYCPVPQEARSCGLRFLDELQKERVDPPGLLFGDPMSCSGDQTTFDVQQSRACLSHVFECPRPCPTDDEPPSLASLMPHTGPAAVGAGLINDN